MKRVMVVAAAVLVSMVAFAGVASSSETAPASAHAGVTVFDLFELSPEQFATMMSNSGD